MDDPGSSPVGTLSDGCVGLAGDLVLSHVFGPVAQHCQLPPKDFAQAEGVLKCSSLTSRMLRQTARTAVVARCVVAAVRYDLGPAHERHDIALQRSAGEPIRDHGTTQVRDFRRFGRREQSEVGDGRL